MQVLCLHSSQSSGAQWRPLKQAFTQQAPDAQLYTPDLIGYGRGIYGPEHPVVSEFRLKHEASVLQPLLDTLIKNQTENQTENHKPFHLIGHSYGGALALHLARQLTALGTPPASIALYEPVAFHVLGAEEPARQEIEAVSASMEALGSAQAAAVFVDYWNHAGYFSGLPHRVQQGMIAKPPKVQADFAALMGEPATLVDYAAITCPVLLQFGVESPQSSRRVAELLAVTIPDVRVQSVQGGHMAPLTAPETVNPGMIDFITAV